MSVTIDPRDVPRCAERLRTALPLAVSEAFGGGTEAAAVEPGTPVAHIAGLGPGHHLHLEETQRLFGLEPVPPQELGEPDVQLRLLSEFTEGGEALAAALSRTLAAGGVLITLRVSGASLETADASPAAVTASLGSDAVSFAVTLHRP